MRFRGFSLIEMLVVVSIIVLLISMLLPALRMGRESAKLAQCHVVLHDLVVATTIATSDNLRRVPFNNWRGNEPGNATVPAGWLYDFKVKDPTAFTVSNPASTVAAHVQTGVLWQYTGSHAAYRCPNDPPPKWTGIEPTWQMTSYTMNGATNAYGGRGATGFMITSFQPKDVLYWEPDYSFWWDGADAPSQGQMPRHLEGGAVANIDGSAEFLSMAAYDLEQLNSPGRLWCVPGSATGH